MKKLGRENKKLFVIVGPTASGKSAFAVKLAKKVNGEVISADSRQIYKGLDIGTGKITKKETAGIPHHLLDVVSPKKTFTVVQYQKLARKKIEEIWRRGKVPILCGGTGFYIQAVVDGIIFPHIPPNLPLRKRLEELKTDELAVLLKKKDANRYKTIDIHNRRRLIRAIEIAHALGRVPPLKKKPLKADIIFFGIKKSKKELKKLLKKRVRHWLRRGLLKEVEKLQKMKIPKKSFQEFGLVYSWALKLYKKEISRQEFIEGLTKDLLSYAKRQITWFKKDKRIKWLEK